MSASGHVTWIVEERIAGSWFPIDRFRSQPDAVALARAPLDLDNPQPRRLVKQTTTHRREVIEEPAPEPGMYQPYLLAAEIATHADDHGQPIIVKGDLRYRLGPGHCTHIRDTHGRVLRVDKVNARSATLTPGQIMTRLPLHLIESIGRLDGRDT